MSNIRYSVPDRVLLKRALDRLRDVPGGLVTLDEEGRVEQTVDNLPADEAGGLAGLNADGKIPVHSILTNVPGGTLLLSASGKIDDARLPANLVRVDGSSKISTSILPTNVTGGVLLLGTGGQLAPERMPPTVVQIDGTGTIPLQRLYTNLPGGVVGLDGTGKIENALLPGSVVRLNAGGKIADQYLPPGEAAFNGFTSYVKSDGYYTLARMRPNLANNGALIVDGHGRPHPVYTSNTNAASNTTTNTAYTRTGTTGYITVNELTTPALATETFGFYSMLSGSDTFTQFSISPGTPMILTWEVSFLGDMSGGRYVFGLANAGNPFTQSAALAFSGGDFAVFRFNPFSTGDNTWRIAMTRNYNADGQAVFQHVTSLVTPQPAAGVPTAIIKLEMRINSSSEVDYYINDVFQYKQTDFYFSNPKNTAALAGRKVIRAVTGYFRHNTGPARSMRLHRFEARVLGDGKASQFFL